MGTSTVCAGARVKATLRLAVGVPNYQSQDVKSDCRSQRNGSKGKPHRSLPFLLKCATPRFILGYYTSLYRTISIGRRLA